MSPSIAHHLLREKMGMDVDHDPWRGW
jgi:hypothetical protein